MSGALNAGKDWLVSKATVLEAERLVERLTGLDVSTVGKITDVTVDSQAASLAITAEFHGETEPIQVRLEQYSITRANGRTYLQARRVRVSRSWMESLARHFVEEKAIEIPELAARALSSWLTDSDRDSGS